jgi:UDP-GlcNAc:undecaprenyl-phosphate/decaprenyl-phosphate GlcNAc-1-phosphate transferase
VFPLSVSRIQLIFALALAAVGVLVLTPIAARILRSRGVIDSPRERSLHFHPTPRGAGLVTGVVLALALSLGWSPLTLSLAFVSLLATMLGGAEDLRGIRVPTRLAGQLGIATVFLLGTWHFGAAPTVVATALSLVFVVAYTNAFNFMDGVNGLSVAGALVAGLTFVGFGSLGAVPGMGMVGLIIATCALCFLPFNFPQARVFLGDSGSYSFGSVIACASVAAWRSGIAIEAVLSPLAIYLADTGTVILRRVVAGQSVATPHRDHTYQKLVSRGASHAQSATVVFVFSLTASLLGLVLVGAGAGARLPVDAAILSVSALYLALPTVAASRFQRTPRAQ